MRTIQETITGSYTFAGSGRYFRILSTAGNLDVSFFQRGSMKEQAMQIGAGYWSRFDQPFDRIDIAGTGVVKFAVSEVEGGYDAVSIIGGVSIAQAGSVSERVVVANNPAVLLVAASGSRKRVIFRNLGGQSVYIGGAGVSTNSAVLLMPGDVFIESSAAGAAFYGFASAASSVGIQEAF